MHAQLQIADCRYSNHHAVSLARASITTSFINALLHVATMSRELMFENDLCICWRTTIAQNAPLKMHRHDRARVIVGIQGGTLKKTEENGSVSDLTFDSGRAYWLEADPPNELHADVNEGCSEVVVMVIEFKTEADRDGTRDPRATCGCGEEGSVKCRCKLGIPPFVMPVGWEPPTSKKDSSVS